jgi:N-acyl homoserine lactone hydrolase
MNYSIQTLKFGDVMMPASGMTFLDNANEAYRIHTHMWVVRGRDTLIAVDTGLREVAYPGLENKFGQLPEEHTEAVLATVGLRASDFDNLIITHLHHDHCESAPLFSKARIVVSRRGWADVMAPRYPQLVPHPLFPRDVFQHLATEAWDRLILAEDEQTIVPGIKVFWTGGHTTCSQAVQVQTEKGRVVLTGDVCFLYDNVERDVPVGFFTDVEQCLRGLEMVRREADVVVPSHDARVFERHPGGRIA